jgi:hypothetical protein
MLRPSCAGEAIDIAPASMLKILAPVLWKKSEPPAISCAQDCPMEPGKSLTVDDPPPPEALPAIAIFGMLAVMGALPVVTTV